MKSVEQRRPPRKDETPICTFIPDPRDSPPPADATPLVTYYIEDRAPPNEACLLLRVERAGRRRRDETPSYVFSCETFPPHSDSADAAQLRFGEWLLRRGLITRAELFRALEQGKAHRCRVGDALVALGALGRGQVEEEATAFATFAGFQGGSPLGLPRGA